VSLLTPKVFFVLFFGLTVTVVSYGQTPAAPPPPALAPIENPTDLAAFTPVVTPAGTAPLAGSNSVTATVSQAETSVATAIDAAFAALTNQTIDASAVGSFGYYMQRYAAFDSTPVMYIIGVPLGALLNTLFFKQTLWALALLFAAVSIASKMKGADASFLDFYASLSLKIFIGGILLTQPAFIYGSLMVIMNSGEESAKMLTRETKENTGGVAARVAAVLGHPISSSIEIRSARDRGIKTGLAMSQAVFTRYAHSPKLNEAATDYWSAFFNAQATAQAKYPSHRNYDPLPRVGQAALDNVLVKVVTSYTNLTFDSANISVNLKDPASFQLDWKYGDYSSSKHDFSVKPLGWLIESKTSEITKAIGLTDTTPTGQQQKIDLLAQYEKAIRDVTSNWIDTEYLGNFNAAMDQAGPLAEFFADLRTVSGRSALSAARVFSPTTWIDGFSSILSVGVTLAQNILLPLLGVLVPFVLNLLLELSLLGLLIATPFWFFAGTERAFKGALETLCACALMLPFWHFFQLLLDLLFAALTSLISTASLVYGARSMVLSGGASAAALGDYTIIIVSGLTIGYIVASLNLAYKTPGIVKAFLGGAGWVTGLLMTVAQGAIASVAATTIGVSNAAPVMASGMQSAAGTSAGGAAAARAAPTQSVDIPRRNLRGALGSMGRYIGNLAASGGNPTEAYNAYFLNLRRSAVRKQEATTPQTRNSPDGPGTEA